MTQSLDKLTIKGFKSIRALENFELTNLNVLIGGNGAGKSNFIDFFRMLRAMMELPLPGLASANLQAYIADGGGSDDFLFNGPKVTEQIEVETRFGPNGFASSLRQLLMKLLLSMMKHGTIKTVLPAGGNWEAGRQLLRQSKGVAKQRGRVYTFHKVKSVDATP